MQLFFPRREKKEQFLVLDIGTETIKTLIFEKIGEKNILSAASLEYLDSYDIPNQESPGIETIKDFISRIVQNLKKEIKRLPENTLLSLPANILRSKVILQSCRRKNPKGLIDEKEANLILEEVSSKTEEAVSQILAEEIGILPKDLHLTSLKILEIKIDGYQVPTLQGYNGKNLVFKILTTFLPEDYFKNIEDIARELGLKRLEILHPAQGLPTINLTEGENSIFLDIGGKTTQIFLIKDGKLEKTEQFEDGGVSFSQSLSQDLGISEKDGRELKERYSKKLLSIEVKNRISEILARPKIDWYNNLKLKIKEMNPKGLLPSIFYLFGGGSQLPEIQEILQEGNWQDIQFREEPKIKFLSPKDCYPPISLKEEKFSSLILNNPQYTPSSLIYHAR